MGMEIRFGSELLRKRWDLALRQIEFDAFHPMHREKENAGRARLAGFQHLNKAIE